MRIGTLSGGRPAHAPPWVRANHWPAAAGVVGAIALAVVLASLHSSATRPFAAPAQHAVAAGRVLAGAPAPQQAAAQLGLPSASVVAEIAQPAPIAQPSPSDPATISALASDGIPVTALDAYTNAARRADRLYPGCDIPWPLLAGIGRVESDHGRFGGAVLRSDGTSSRKILGISLDGNGTAVIIDTDHGRLDGDTKYDRAVGPMQFIPSTWARYGVDGNHDGKVDPFNIYDAAAAAADYLCTAGGELSTHNGQTRAVLAYNHSSSYLNTVVQLERTYAKGVAGLVVPVPPAPVKPPPVPHVGGKVPPVDPGRPLGAPHHKPHTGTGSTSAAPTDTQLPTWVGPPPSSPTSTPSSTPVTSTSSSPCTSTTDSTSASDTSSDSVSDLPSDPSSAAATDQPATEDSTTDSTDPSPSESSTTPGC